VPSSEWSSGVESLECCQRKCQAEDRQTGRKALAGRLRNAGAGGLPMSVAFASVPLAKPPARPPAILPARIAVRRIIIDLSPGRTLQIPDRPQYTHQDLSRIALAASSPQAPRSNPPSPPVPQSPSPPAGSVPSPLRGRSPSPLPSPLCAPLPSAKTRARPVPAGVSAAGRSWPTCPTIKKPPKRLVASHADPARPFFSLLGSWRNSYLQLRLRTVGLLFPVRCPPVRCLCSNS
jgi:hypothetical protein